MGGDYIEGLVGQPQYINPLLAPANDVDLDLSRIVYAGLLKFDKELNLTPDLAENMPELSADGKEYTFTLKKNLFWHDGHELKSDDVVFTFQKIQDTEAKSPLRTSWSRVQIQKIDDHQLKITTRESSATFIANFTTGILPKHIWENISSGSFTLSKYNLEPIGAGPYEIASVKRTSDGQIKSMEFRAFKNYYTEGPYISKLIFKFYETQDQLIEAYHGKDIQGLGYVPFDQNLFIEPKNKLKQIVLPLPQYQAVFINRPKNPVALDDVRVRTALGKAINKQQIISEVYGGKAAEAYGPILPGHLGFHEQISGADMNIYDPGKARELLDASGWALPSDNKFRKDKQGRTISLSLATNNFSPNVRVADLLKKMWEDIGVEVVLHIETITDLEEKFIRPRNFELLLFSENVGADPDPFPFWHSSQLRDPGLNLSNFSNKDTDKLLADARTNIPSTDRATKYKRFQELFVGDVPALFLNRNVFVYNVSTDIKGVDLSNITIPADRFADIDKWYIETKQINK